MARSSQERRTQVRTPKRMMLTFRKIGDEKGSMGVTTDVSATGLFLSSGTLHPRGTRLRIAQAGSAPDAFVEVEVQYIRRRDPLVQSGETGMGLRVVGSVPLSLEPPAPALRLLTLAFENASEFFEVIRRDLKSGIALVRVEDAPAIGSTVEVEIVPPVRTARSPRFRAKVTAHRSRGVMVEFENREAMLDALLSPAAPR